MTTSDEPTIERPGDITLRPAEFAHLALASIGVAEGRRRRRQRDTLADTLGLELKLDLLFAIQAADPEPAEFQQYLLEYALQPGRATGPVRGVCSDVWLEWESALTSPGYVEWLRQGAQEHGEDTRAPGRGGVREHFRPDHPAARPSEG